MSVEKDILKRIEILAQQPAVWTAVDFFDLGKRDAVDKALQRLVKANKLRRIDRGLYDKPKINSLTGALEMPDYQKVIEAISRRDQFRMLIDGLTAANDIGLTNVVPGQVNVLTDGRLHSIKINNLTINFKHTAPSKLYWAGRPAMRIVQALYWLGDVIKNSQSENHLIKERLSTFINHSDQKAIFLSDLREGLITLPVWMQTFLKDIFALVDKNKNENK
jgi:hypothetical protein